MKSDVCVGEGGGEGEGGGGWRHTFKLYSRTGMNKVRLAWQMLKINNRMGPNKSAKP